MPLSPRSKCCVAILVICQMCATAATAQTAPEAFGWIEKLSGDRQIRVGPFSTSPLSPISVQVFDLVGHPLPGVIVYVATSNSGSPCALLIDEFLSWGFNTPFGDSRSCSPPSGAITALSDAQGVATKAPPAVAPTPSSFLIGATITLPEGVARRDVDFRQFFTIVRAESKPAGNPTVVVEYFHDTYRHYFNTVLQVEIDALDRGLFTGWTRSVGGFIAWATAADAPPEAVPVCRFYNSQHVSHFYTADSVECDQVISNFPDWKLESREAYYILLPDKSNGQCAAGTMPMYRVFNGTSSPNHRYVSDRSLRDRMVAAGWIPEGYGPDAVIMCTPR